MKPLHYAMTFFALIALVAGCAPLKQPALQSFDPGSTRSVGSKYAPKVDNFQVILDSSLSMNEYGSNDFVVARDVLRRMNQGIPTDLSYNGGLRSIGHDPHQSPNPTELLYGMTSYQQAGFHDALGKINYVGGSTPMATALQAAGKDLAAGSGKSALIVVSDGLHMENAPAMAESIKGMLGDNLCIYTIAIGNENNGAGQDMLKRLADVGQCGFATTDALLADDASMAAFVDNVFIAGKPTPKPVAAPRPKPIGDSDGDGVTDDKDQCPNTPRGDFVDESGCTLKLTLHINFAHDKYDIKPEFKSDLDRAAAYIKRYSNVPYIMIAGHTDRDGTVEYNQTLSENRANAVRDYLIKNYGIDGKRLIAKGYGKLQPVADNSTKEGRYQNRRVEVICCVLKPE